MRPDETGRTAQLALDDHPMATVVLGLDGAVSYANRAAETLFLEEAPDRTLSAWSAGTRPLRALLRRVAASSSWVPIRLTSGDREVHARARGIRGDADRPPGVLVMVSSEATEPFLRRAEHLRRLNDQLAGRKRAEARMEFALEAVGIGIWEYDVASDSTWRSAWHDRIFGYATPLAEWTVPIFLDHIVEADRAETRRILEESIAHQKPYRLQCRIVRVDGAERWILVDGAPLVGPDGRTIMLNGVVSDVTEAREAEQRIIAAERMESLGQMAGGLAHDFSNVIGIIRLQAEVALLTRDAAAVWSRLDAIQQAAARGAELAARTLAFAKREPGMAEAVAVRPLVRQVMDLTFGGGTRILAVDTEAVADLHVFCDPGQLENALLNLAFNARDAIVASGTGNRLVLSARACGDGMVAISVSDNGPGMSRCVLDRAANPFFTTKEGAGGTGLGLSTVSAFTASAGGGVDIRSAPGEGTTVTLTLPEAAAPVAAPEDEAVPAGKVPRLRLIVVEDEPRFREALELMLAAMGHGVRAFAAAAPALEALKDGVAADALITDVLLAEGMNGFDLARAAAGIRPDLEVVYLSGYAHDSLRDGAPRGQFLRKPVEGSDLSRALCRVATALGVRVGA